MMIWTILIKVLMIAKVCQSLTVIQPTYNYDDKYYKPKEIQNFKNETTAAQNANMPNAKHYIRNEKRIEYGLRKSTNFKTKNNNLTHDLSQLIEAPGRIAIAKSQITQPYELALKTRLLSRVEPYKAGMISNILSVVQPSTRAFHEQPAFSNIYPVQYQYRNPYHKALTKPQFGSEPVTAATLKTEILHQPKETFMYLNNSTQPLLKYNNKVYHIIKAISNQSYAQQYPPFIRKQRNSNAHHYGDKLIEHNFTEIRDDNEHKDYEQDLNRTAASIKQPSTSSSSSSSSSSHEIRYLHDIFLNYPKYHHVNYGHIELSPNLFEKRFETLKAGNRYKGEVIWLDNTGGYSQHYWNMAQGKL